MRTKKMVLMALLCFSASISCTQDRAKTKAERQGWHLSIQSYTFHLFSGMESLDKTQELRVRFIEIYPGQRMGEGIGEAVFGHQLSEDEQKRLKETAARGKQKASKMWYGESST